MDDVLKRARSASLLKAIEQQLRQQKLWRSEPPNVERMSSTLPFACDQLSLEEWLQFLFIPRMQQLLNSGASLPVGAGLAPYAEVVYRDRLSEMADLLALLREVDRVLATPSAAGSH